MFEKGDLVRTPRGYFGVVNWADDEGDVGVSFHKAPHYPGAMMYKAEELVLIKRGEKEFWNRAFSSQTDDMIREEIGMERSQRTILPTERERGERKEDRVTEMLKELTEEERIEFINLMKKGGKGNV